MYIPSEKLAVISTSHVTADTAEWLDFQGPRGVVAMRREEGWLVSTRPRRIDAPDGSLAHVLGFLRDAEFVWVLFDRDAEAVEGLPTYDW